MAQFVRFFRISPSDYWALRMDEDQALEAQMNAELESRKGNA